ncbi:J domain-containing protein [Bdellovibrionota bacterium FG-1]
MLGQTIQTFIQEHFGDEGGRHFFYLLQIGVGALFFALFWLFRKPSLSSRFAVTEADLLAQKKKMPKKQESPPSKLADARIERKVPLGLSGIRIDGPAHEILGVSPGASAQQIQQAYRERMKQYHPDKIGTQGSQQWRDSQKIAEAINRAKEEMLRAR